VTVTWLVRNGTGMEGVTEPSEEIDLNKTDREMELEDEVKQLRQENQALQTRNTELTREVAELSAQMKSIEGVRRKVARLREASEEGKREADDE